MTDTFNTIKTINNADKETWNNHKFLTLDIDWACDEVLTYSIDFIEKYNVPATWFITHDTPILDRLRENPNFELGIHPNFNPLLDGDNRLGKNSNEVIANIKNIVPEAKSVRSHSMTQSSNLLDLFKDHGLTHDSNHFIPTQSNIELKPWTHWNGLTKVPYFWEDDVACIYNDLSIEKHFDKTGLKVFDFHPIHIFLNTETLQRYEDTRPLHQNAKSLLDCRNTEKYGTCDALKQLLETA